MATANRPAQNRGISNCRPSSRPLSSNAPVIVAIASAKTGNHRPRRYQRELSKHRMKLSRYNASGRTHSNGSGATFCVRWVVTASNAADGQNDSNVHIESAYKEPFGSRVGARSTGREKPP